MPNKVTTRNASSSVDQIQRVVFLGNSITYSGQYIADIEAYYHLVHPTLQIEWIIQIVREKQQLMRDARLTAIGHSRP